MARNDTLRGHRANNYAVASAQRYWQEGNPRDLHELIRFSEEAVAVSVQAASILGQSLGTVLHQLSIEVHSLNNLAARLDEHFQLTGSLDNLNRSIDIMERLAACVPWEDWQDSRAEWLVNPAASLQRPYEQDEGESQRDIDRSIDLSREAINIATLTLDITPNDHPSRAQPLQDARRRASPPPRPKESKALLVAMDNTAYCSLLVYATKEIETVEDLLRSNESDTIRLDGDTAREQNTLQHLKACQISHFAGHGVEHVSDAKGFLRRGEDGRFLAKSKLGNFDDA
ncbi:hypothetical protein B0T10DRAFT_467415 [Thelonectria olida]|uniref:Uncharacterized protein n=1 Tax=Thelonectria olida TaxID=1576542 RepID=A0A9P8VMT4_9HYPO|nr:hypothetical protein B0T10DRAFT_467415 [Thelonectria olida]